jgi:4-amino-4-deoxy-L-arabinose transferase-like glycosyltransferase
VLVAVTLAAILAGAVSLRLQRLAEYRYVALDPDAVGYLQIARELRLARPFDTDYREPAFIWLVRAATRLAGDQPTTIRGVSVGASALTVGLTYWLAASQFGPAAGLAAAGILAVNRELTFQSVRGLKEEVFTVGLLGVVLLLFGTHRPNPVWRWLMAGLVAGTMALVRLTGLLPAAVLLADRAFVEVLDRDPRWRRTLLPAAAAGLLLMGLVLPYLVQNARTAGDPFHSINANATWFRNIEFAGRPGFPSKEAVRQNAYTGPPVTSFEYVFGLHTAREILHRHVDGARWLYGFWVASLGVLVTVVGLAGLLRLVASRRHFVPAALGAAVFPFLFGFTVAPDMSRFAVPTFPFLAAAFAWLLMASAWAVRARVATLLHRASGQGPWPDRLALGLSAVLVAIVLSGYGYREMSSRDYVYDEDFNDLGWRASHEARTMDGWSLATDGLSLVPEQAGTLVYQFDRRRFKRASLRLWFYAPPGVANWLEVSGDGRSFTTVSHNRHYEGTVLDLSDLMGGRRRFYLRFRASYEAREGPEHLVVDKFTLRLHD